MKAKTWARMAMGWKCVAVLASFVLGSIWNILEQRFQRTAHDFSGVKDELQNKTTYFRRIHLRLKLCQGSFVR